MVNCLGLTVLVLKDLTYLELLGKSENLEDQLGEDSVQGHWVRVRDNGGLLSEIGNEEVDNKIEEMKEYVVRS